MMHLAFVILSLALGLSTGAKIEMDKETDFGNPNINLNDNFNLTFVSLEETRQDSVSCGSFQLQLPATTCADCPQGNGASWCHGDCQWVNEQCQSKERGGLASGCPSSPNAIQNSQDMISTTQTGAVRCCSFDGGSCESETPDCSTLTFSNAKQECSEFGMRLCTEEELAGNICCGTGCGFDFELVWYTKVTGLASGCPSRPSAIQNSQVDMISTTQTGAVRCCSFDGGSCETETPDCSTLTFSNARQECSEFGMRLCTEEELADNICCGTGCGFDYELVWYTKDLCSMVAVSLKNEVSIHKIEFAGDYQISETVNGKPSWKSGENAIWYGPVGNNWMIGYWKKLGENDGEFYAPNKYGGLSDNRNVWKYTMDDSTWITPSDLNDVIISCSGALVSVCKEDWFDCKSAVCTNPYSECDGTCIPKYQVNNGKSDCSDGSDEGIIETCEEPNVCCAGDLQECPGMCIKEEYVQNGYPDCFNWGIFGRDEIGCEDNNNRGTNLLDLVLIPGSTSKKRSACWEIEVDQGVWDQASRDYAGAFCSNWYGWSSDGNGDHVNGRISTRFNTMDVDGMRERPAKGCAKLDFENCFTSGTVQVYLGDPAYFDSDSWIPMLEIASTAGRKTVEFEFESMTKLTIQEENGAIIQINSLDIIPCDEMDKEDDVDLKNAGKECFQKCKKQNGPCDWCGSDGWCCRENRVRNGCDGTIGGANRHQCVLHPGSN